MINPIGSGMQMPQIQSSQSSMSAEQKEKVQAILSQFSSKDLSNSDANSIVESFAELNITPTKELDQLMADNGFDAKSIGDMAGIGGSQMPPPPPPKNDASNSSEMVSFLVELLENYDSQLSDDDNDAILSAVQEKFATNGGDSLINVKA